ncbi:MAG: DUF3179 domain-containing protein [Inquilinus sp.]|nr:DUF3179 domain-containing protein [Inquilinus sp.]
MKTPHRRHRPTAQSGAGAAAPIALAGLLALATGFAATLAAAEPRYWRAEWPATDFEKTSIDLSEIISGGPPKDGIPSIDAPVFVPVAEAADLAPTEPVLSLEIAGDARAYPLRVLIWHEIVNDTVGGAPVAVTYCPLCNSGIVFDRVIDGRETTFGTTGKLRRSDMVMYDRLTESWWQQFLGEAVVGELTGTVLDIRPSRLESVERFAARHPDGRVLVPANPRMRSYGRNPYAGYDSTSWPFLYRGDYDGPVPALARVVAVGDQAWTLDMLRRAGRIEAGDLVLTWEAGQNSALDTAAIAEGRDVGNVVVQRRTADGLADVPYDIPFAFAFRAFMPEGVLHHDGA